jgi:DNA processing protein
MDRIRGWLQLLNAPGVGNATAVKLSQKYGEPHKFIGALPQDISKSELSIQALEYLNYPDIQEKWEYGFELMEQYKIKFVTYLDDEYPQSLRNIYDSPAILFYRGKLDSEYLRRSVQTASG